MKKTLSILLCIFTLSIFSANAEDFNYNFTIRHYRYGDYSIADFNTQQVNGSGYISLDDDGNAYVTISCNGTNKTFNLSSSQILSVNDSNGLQIVYRYGNGEVHVDITQNGVSISQFIGKRFWVWKEATI